jgi:hypothetical protein
LQNLVSCLAASYVLRLYLGHADNHASDVFERVSLFNFGDEHAGELPADDSTALGNAVALTAGQIPTEIAADSQKMQFAGDHEAQGSEQKGYLPFWKIQMKGT